MIHTETKPYLSVIIPVYKQSKTIVKNIEQILEALDATPYSFELIPVVDGTTIDDSLGKLQTIKDSRVKPFGYDKNSGKSYAIRYGMKEARGEIVTFIDAGMDIDPQGIIMLLEHMKWYDADIIVGSKRHPVSQVQYTWQRRVLSLGYYLFVKVLFGVKVKDTQAGIKVFKKTVLEKILPRLVEKRFAGDLEMLVVAKTLGFDRIYEAPIKLNYDFGNLSSAATWRQIIYIIIDTLAIFYRAYILRYYTSKKQSPDNLVPAIRTIRE